MESRGLSLGQQNVQSGFKEARRAVPACLRCHSLKVKCIPVNPDLNFGLCLRCKKSGNECSYNLEATQKKRKAGSEPISIAKRLQLKSLEVEELKQRLLNQDRLIRHLKGINNPQDEKEATLGEMTSNEKLLKFGAEIDCLKGLNKNQDSIKSTFVNVSEQRLELSETFLPYKLQDIIKDGILTLPQCERLIQIFKYTILPKYPFVEIGCELNAQYLIDNDYLLFLVIVYIGLVADPQSISIPINKHLQLENLITRSLSIEILSVGKKNLSLLKCLLLYCIWYPSPELFHHRRYHFFTILCTSMANDLGLTGRPYLFYNREDGTFQKSDSTSFNNLAINSNIETKSLILVIYIIMGSISLYLRRRVLFQWTDYMNQCCLSLESSNNKNYQLISIYARINYILEKIYTNIHSNSEHISIIELSSTNNQILVEEYQTQLNHIKQRIHSIFSENDDTYHSLMSYLYSTQAYIYEPCIQSIVRSKGQDTSLNEDYSYIVYNMISKLCDSCNLSIEHFNQLSNESITSNPLFHTSRIIYTTGLLLKIRHLSLTTNDSSESGNICMKFDIFTNKSNDLFSNLFQKIESTIEEYPRNHFLKKVSIVLGLYTSASINQWYSSYQDLANEIKLKDLNFVDPKQNELRNFKRGQQHLNFPITAFSESGTSSNTPNDNTNNNNSNTNGSGAGAGAGGIVDYDAILPPLDTIDEFEQQLLSLNDEMVTELFFQDGLNL